jgi:hypothetical protein
VRLGNNIFTMIPEGGIDVAEIGQILSICSCGFTPLQSNTGLNLLVFASFER